VEALLSRPLPVEVLAQGVWVRTEPAFVEARGPRSQVEAAVAAVGLDQGEEVALTAFGPEGPLPAVTLSRPRRGWWPGRSPCSARCSPWS
jgi:hypothetical protein